MACKWKWEAGGFEAVKNGHSKSTVKSSAGLSASPRDRKDSNGLSKSYIR